MHPVSEAWTTVSLLSPLVLFLCLFVYLGQGLRIVELVLVRVSCSLGKHLD